MKRALAVLLALCWLTSPALAVPGADDAPGILRPLRVGGDRDYPPYEFLDKNGKPAGFNIDLTTALAETMGMRVGFSLGAWSVELDALKKGSVDVLHGMTYSEDRAKYLDFIPHTVVNHAIFARRDTKPVSNIDELSGKKVIVHRAGYMNEVLASKGFAGDLILTDTPADGLRLLASGQGEYAVVAMLPGSYIIRENKLNNLQAVARSVATVRYGYAVPKGNDALVARLSEGLAILRETRRYQHIHDKWLGVLQAGKFRWETIALYAGGAAVVLFVLLGGAGLWTHVLRKQVAQRTRSLSMALEELSRNQRQLVQADKMAALGTLVSGVAHEINNPNGLILLNIPLLRKVQTDAVRLLDAVQERGGDFTLGGIGYTRMKQEWPRMLEDMQEGATRIKRIVSDLKDFARQEEGAGKALIDLNDASRKAVRLVEPTIRKHTRNFVTRYEDDLPLLWGNSQRIEQVVVNLVLNACQALPDNLRAIEISTHYLVSEGKVMLCVYDEGTGIAPEHLAHLTDPFFTTKRESGGTGLGLSVSAGIAKDHGGLLSFESQTGQWSKACLALPTAPEDMTA